jgi:serine/threonine protein kinase
MSAISMPPQWPKQVSSNELTVTMSSSFVRIQFISLAQTMHDTFTFISHKVALHYTPERILGKGGFGCVYMAAAKSAPSNQVAIKVVKDDGYAEREIAILSELMKYSHPNIVKIFGSYAPQDGDDPYSCMRCLVLALARGPPLNYILKQRGALGLMMAQKIASQLVNTVAFLHGHGVIHRDIQPVRGMIARFCLYT